MSLEDQLLWGLALLCGGVTVLILCLAEWRK